MKRSAMQYTRWTALSLLFLALAAGQSRPAVAQSMLAAGDVFQQFPKPASPPELPQVTTETRADLLVIHHQYLAAVAMYKANDPQTAGIYNKTGIAYEHMFMDKDAKANFEHALKIDNKMPQAYNNLGTVYYHEKNYKRAERFYKKAIKLSPEDARVYGNLGTLYLARRKLRDGTEAYQRAFLLNPGIFQEIAENGIQESTSAEDLANMNYCFAKIYAQAGKNDLAMQYLAKAVSEGFRDKSKIQQDQEFASLRGTPEFQQLMSKEGR
jgi:tetratricopeptide (TPR) repeat protein